MAGRPHAGQLRPGVPTAQLHQPPRWFQVSNYPPLLYLVRIASTFQQSHSPECHSYPKAPPPQPPTSSTPAFPPPSSPVASRSSIREGKSQAPAPAPAPPLQLHDSSGCLCSRFWPLPRQLVFHMLLFFTLLLLPPLSFSSDSSRPAPASSPNAGWQSCHAILVLFSLSLFSNGLSAPTRSDQVRPDSVNGARPVDHVPKEKAITLRFWPLMGSAQKFACLIAVLPPANWD